MRECKKCGKAKPDALFAKQGKYRRRTCKACESKRVRKAQVKNPSYIRPTYIRHGLTEIQYLALVAKSNGMCWSCKEEVATVIDHDHSCCGTGFSCGKCVRGLLCRGCNLAAGMLLDKPERATLLAQYLVR